jgi:hypothetical protein
MMEAIRSSQISVLTRATRRNIPEDVFLIRKLVTNIWQLGQELKNGENRRAERIKKTLNLSYI